MVLDQQPSDEPDDLPPPPPPPKKDFHSSPSSPNLPPDDYFNSKSSSLSSSPMRRHFSNTYPLSPPLSGTSGERSTPAVDLSPLSPSLKAQQSKKSNPLTDLVDSEREYIDVLAGIIRKVAGAWSRSNFPPKQLDTMFRGIEAIYKANRGLLTRLKEIGPTPTSPKALGDLLMRWIDDLDAPYTKFCTNYVTGFDVWDPIVSNTRLPPILGALSTVHPPPSALPPSLSTNSDHNRSPAWTLDALFALPRARLKYYKKLYTRLLKSTQPGRSDHKLLTGAVERLESLLGILAEREGVVIAQKANGNTNAISPAALPPNHSSLEPGDHIWTERTSSNISGSETTDDQNRGSVGSSNPQSSMSSEARASRDTSNNGTRVVSSATMSMPISNLERRLSTERVLDIFTLRPKAVRLQMNPPSLTFTRSLRISHNVEIHFTPRAAPDAPRIHTQGHIFLLTDLFLVCERMTPEERLAANTGADGQDYDMWLLYPPLAGKHLRVSETPDQNNVLQIQILKKEILFLHTDSKAARDSLLGEFKECIEAASLVSPRSSQPPPPPVPPIKTQPLSSDKFPESREAHLSSKSETYSAVSPMSALNLNPSPRPWDQSRLSGDTTGSSRQASTSNRSSFHSPSPAPARNDRYSNQSPDPDAGQDQVRRMPLQSVSQPQLHPSGPSGSSYYSPQTIPSSASSPLLPPPRVASNPQYQVDRQPGLPMRPATAPGLPQYGARPAQPNFPPPRAQSPASFKPRSPSSERLSNTMPPSSDPMSGAALRKSPSSLSLGSFHQQPNGVPPPMPTHAAYPSGGFLPRDGSLNFTPPSQVHQPHPRLPFPPPAAFSQRAASLATTSSWGASTREPSPPSSPIDDDPIPSGPVTSTITAQFKCKVFLQLHHGQWKSLGGGRLKLYLQQPTNVKQLVVEADSKDKAVLISTIVLTDGVERVGRTGVAIELSDQGARTGIVYMIQLRNEVSASGLFDSLLVGSDRAAGRPGRG